ARGAATGKSIELRFSTDESLPPVWVDPTRMTQLFDNLLSNAIKFTPEDGIVDVAITRQRDAARIEVRDTGVGIPERELGILCDRFLPTSTRLPHHSKTP